MTKSKKPGKGQSGGTGNHLDVSCINNHEDCLRLALAPEPKRNNKLRLNLDINFADEWINLSTRKYLVFTDDWRTRFCLKAGELIFKLNGLISHPSAREFKSTLAVEIVTRTTGKQAETATEESEANAADLNAGFDAKGPKVGGGASSSKKKAKSLKAIKSTSDTYETKTILIHAKGGDYTPTWTFRAQAIDGTLNGHIDEKLADLKVEREQIQLSASFVCSYSGLQILEVDGITFHEKSDPKKAAIVQLIHKSLYESIQQYVSKVDIVGNYDFRS